jgi:hypothetical protein
VKGQYFCRFDLGIDEAELDFLLRLKIFVVLLHRESISSSEGPDNS